MIKQISPQETLALVESEKAILIDVREPEEFAEGHIPYAISIPMSVIDKGLQKIKIPTDKIVIFQCRSGGRSNRVCDFVLQTKCISNEVCNMSGGFNQWQDEALPFI